MSELTPVFVDPENQIGGERLVSLSQQLETHVQRLQDDNIVPVVYRSGASQVIANQMGINVPAPAASASYCGVQYTLAGIPQNQLSESVVRVLNQYTQPEHNIQPSAQLQEQIAQKKAIAKDKSRKILFGVIFGMNVLQMQGRLLLNDPLVSNDSQYVLESDFIPEVFIGAVPLNCVQRIERGMSDLIIKYRAVGDVFLAHQKGSLTSLRIDGRFIGPFRKMYLVILLALQFSGRTKLKDITNPVQIDEQALEDDGRVETEGDQYASHDVIPIFTQTDIILDMYLQTIEWHHAVDEGGTDIISYSLLFRKYVDPKEFRVFDNKVYAAGTFETKHGMETRATTRKRFEAQLDLMWKMGRIGVEVMRYGFTDGKTFAELNREAFASDPYFRSADTIAKIVMAQNIEGLQNVS